MKYVTAAAITQGMIKTMKAPEEKTSGSGTGSVSMWDPLSDTVVVQI